MSTLHLVDPDTREFMQAFEAFEFDRDSLPALREAHAQMFLEAQAQTAKPASELAVAKETVMVPRGDGSDVRCVMYRPLSDSTPAAYLHIHGGGYVIGAPEMMEAALVALSERLGITVLSVDYRLAPEHPFPAGMDDCYSALAWLNQESARLGIDPDRIAVGGESAGGGLAAALAQHVLARAEYSLCFQLLVYPMLDNLTGSEAQPADATTGEFVWTREANQKAWEYYLADTGRIAPGVPAAAENLEGLPTTWLATGALDLFREENVVYAQRLMAAGVSTELIIYPGAPHGFQLAIEAPLARRFDRDCTEALARGLGLA